MQILQFRKNTYPTRKDCPKPVCSLTFTIFVSLKSAARELVQDSGNSVRKKFFSRIFKIRYLRDYLELEKNKNISPHLLVEICSFPGSFEMTETIRGYQNMFSLQKIERVLSADSAIVQGIFSKSSSEIGLRGYANLELHN